MDIQKLVDRAKELIMDPTAAWAKIRGESVTVEEVYKTYLIPLALAGAAATFVATSIMGSGSMIPSLIAALFMAALGLAGVYIAALILEWLAPKFACTPTRIDCFKWVGFASIVQGVAKLLVILPSILSILALLLALYGLYVGFIGFQPMTGVSDAKKWPLFLVYLLCLFVVGFVLMLPVSLLMGAFMFMG
jgi:hypothetical protein